MARNDPGHFREYTKSELIEIANMVGLKIVNHKYKDDFSVEGKRFERLRKAVLYACPFPARGQATIFQKPNSTS